MLNPQELQALQMITQRVQQELERRAPRGTLTPAAQATVITAVQSLRPVVAMFGEQLRRVREAKVLLKSGFAAIETRERALMTEQAPFADLLETLSALVQK